MGHVIVGCVMLLLAAGALAISVRSFREKGMLLNNAYLYATKQTRETMDKKPYYRQSALVFLLIGIIFLLNGFAVLMETAWISYISMAVLAVTVIYAIASDIRIKKRSNKSHRDISDRL